MMGPVVLMVEVFEVALAAEGLLGRVRLDRDSEDGRRFCELVETANGLARPTGVYRECFVEGCVGEQVVIDGVTFTSRALAEWLGGVHRVFPYVLTCGSELDAVPIAEGDFVEQYWLDAIREAVLREAMGRFKVLLTHRYGLAKTAGMQPGSGDATVWPIEQQRELFSLLGDVTAAIGVTLTDSCLMIPNKSVAGVRFPTAVDFRSCQLCRREGCPTRSSAFDPALWQRVHDQPGQPADSLRPQGPPTPESPS